MSQIDAVDKYTVRFVLSAPSATFLANLGGKTWNQILKGPNLSTGATTIAAGGRRVHSRATDHRRREYAVRQGFAVEGKRAVSTRRATIIERIFDRWEIRARADRIFRPFSSLF